MLPSTVTAADLLLPIVKAATQDTALGKRVVKYIGPFRRTGGRDDVVHVSLASLGGSEPGERLGRVIGSSTPRYMQGRVRAQMRLDVPMKWNRSPDPQEPATPDKLSRLQFIEATCSQILAECLKLRGRYERSVTEQVFMGDKWIRFEATYPEVWCDQDSSERIEDVGGGSDEVIGEVDLRVRWRPSRTSPVSWEIPAEGFPANQGPEVAAGQDVRIGGKIQRGPGETWTSYTVTASVGTGASMNGRDYGTVTADAGKGFLIELNDVPDVAPHRLVVTISVSGRGGPVRPEQIRPMAYAISGPAGAFEEIVL